MMSMNTLPEAHPSWEALAAFDLGQLADGAWSTVVEHLAHCEKCSKLLDTVPDDGFVRGLRISKSPADKTELADELPDALVAHPRYRVLELLGRGGMGAVYKAEHLLMERLVALKVLNPGVVNRSMALERFFREVKALARLSHPNIVTAFDAEQAGDTLFLVMEFVEGESLDRVLRRSGMLPVGLACNWIRQAALGLQFAFEQGLIHRDLKPANLLLTPQGQIKILDFGLARLRGDTRPDATRTPDGVVLETPAYVAPEQARAPQTADIRADLYSLGCTWYEMLAGRPPLVGSTILQQLLAHQEQTPPPLAQFRSDLPAATVAIVERLLAKDPAARFPTPQELLQTLTPDAVAAPSPPAASRKWTGLAVAAVVAAVGLALALTFGPRWFRGEDPGGPPGAAPSAAQKERTPAGLNPGDSKPSGREQAVAWIKEHGAVGRARVLAEDHNRLLEDKLTKGNAFILRLGQGLVQSGRPTWLGGRHHDFFVFELPAEPLGAADYDAVLRITAEQSQEFHAQPPVLLSELQIDDKHSLSGDRNLTGSASYQTAAPVSGMLAFRLTFMLGSTTRTHYELLEDTGLTGAGRLSFSFSPLNSDVNPWAGRTVLFIDLCSLDRPNSKSKALVLSNTLADLVRVRDAK
jgi:Protein kinase domain